MKKYITIIALIAIIVPSVALASWWNPLSWFKNWIFGRVHYQSQTIQNNTEEIPSVVLVEVETSVEDDVSSDAINDDLEIAIPAPKAGKAVTINDVCLNITGVQVSAPQGFVSENNLCTTIPIPAPTPADVCSNIEGIQTLVPSGTSLVNGQCITIQVDVCSNIEGIQTSVPNGMTEDDEYCSTPTSNAPTQQNIVTVEPHVITFTANGTYTDDNIPGQNYDALNGIIVQVVDYWESDTVTAVLKDGNTILEPLPNSEQRVQSSSATGPCDRSYPCSVENYYSVPLEEHTYIVEVTVNGVTKSNPITVNPTVFVNGGGQLGFARMQNQGNPQAQFNVN